MRKLLVLVAMVAGFRVCCKTPYTHQGFKTTDEIQVPVHFVSRTN